jgi:hypothetical protein
MWFICAFHLIVGIGLNVSPAFPQFMADYYGAQVSWTPALVYLVKPLGAFMLVLGVLAGVAARNPLAHTSVVYGFVLLFSIRGLQRLIFQDEIGTAMAIDASRNLGNAIFFLAMAAILVLFYRLASKPADSID